MKTFFKGFLIASLMFVGVAAYAQTLICSNVGTIDVTKTAFDGNKVDVAYTVTVDPAVKNIIDVKGQKGVVLTTVLAEGPFKQVIECLVISPAKGNCKTDWIDAKCKAVTPNVRYFQAYEDQPLVIRSNYTIEAEEWFSPNTEITVTAQEYKDLQCLVHLIGAIPAGELDPTEIVPAWAYIPAPVGTSAEHSFSTKIFYPVNVTTEVSDYLENAQALSLLRTLDSPNFNVNNIAINGWASPESSVAYNQRLSERRAATMKDIIAARYSYPDALYTVAGNGEYWADIDAFAAASDDPALRNWAARSFSNLDAKEAALKQLSAYKNIASNFYPRARFADCIVTYKLINFDPVAVRELYNAYPEVLSEAEYAALAVSDGEVNAEILAKGLELYPESEYLSNIAAKCAVAEGDYEKAIEYLRKAGDSNEVVNNIGVCYMLLGNKTQARVAFLHAWGIPEASENLIQLRKVE